MEQNKLKIVILGLSITSSWGNGHATTFRGLIKGLNKLGHDVLFLERDVPWYASQRDEKSFPYCQVELYQSLEDLKKRFTMDVKNADVVIVGSYVPEGVDVGKWVISTANGVKAFYDIDTPVTLAKLEKKDYEYLSPGLISHYDLYLSFTGGKTLDKLEKEYKSQKARPLYCSFDPDFYYPGENEIKWDMGYLGTYSMDRQPTLDNLLLNAARHYSKGKFVVAGPQYPKKIEWPENVERIEHLPPGQHRNFYTSQRFTLNVTRDDMKKAGYAPSVRLFEAAACGTPIISDYWEGIDSIFIPGKEIFIANSYHETLEYLQDLTEPKRLDVSKQALAKVMKFHTSHHRAKELVGYIMQVKEGVIYSS
ncbi:MAG: CgeB family protein [Bacteroidota bacterium]